MEQEGYIRASTRERLLLIEMNKQIDFTIIYTTPVKEYSKYDAIISSGGTEYIVETKTRTGSSQFPGYTIEEDKYKYLMEQSKVRDLVPLYILFFNDAVLVFDLNKCTPPIFEMKNMQVNDQDLRGQYIQKSCQDMLTNEAYRYNIEMPIAACTEEALRLYNKHYKHI